MNEQSWSKRLLVFALPVIVLLFYLRASSHFDYTTDDAYIYLQFANNFIQGKGISFNAGEPTYGITSPLWLFVISLGGWLGVDLFLAAKAIDLVIASCAILVFYFVAFEVIRDMIVSMLATFAFSLHIGLLRWAGSGMETSLSVLLVLAVFLFCLRNEYLLSIVFAALLTLTRPEACILVGFLLYDIYINSHDKQRARKLIIRVTAVYAALLAPWLIYAYVTFGTVIPNTALAKSRFGFDLPDMIDRVLGIINILGASDAVAIVVLIGSGVFLFIYFRKNTPSKESDEEKFFLKRLSILGFGWIIALPLLYCIRHVVVVQRYLLLISPFILVLAFSFLFRTVMKSRFAKFTYATVVLCAGLIVIQNQTVYRVVVAPGIEAHEIGINTSLISIGKWLKENTSPEETVLAWDIGAVGFYSDRKICDAAGLVTPGMIPYLHDGYSMKQMIDENVYEPLCDVGYIVHCSQEPEELKTNPNLEPLFSRPFYGRGLLTNRIDYYTLYKVKNHHSQQKESM